VRWRERLKFAILEGRSEGSMGQKGLTICLLGDLAVMRDGRPLELPASKKTRALLGYLTTTGGPHTREKLCELFWEGPDDPRAQLRWSLTKIRPLIDDRRTTRLVADRDRVAFEARGAEVDLVEIRAAVAGGVAATSTESLQTAAARFRGELLEALELPSCYRFHEWCVGEREAVRALHARVLTELCARLVDQPEEALRCARARVTADPLTEAAHVAVIRILGRLGRGREALEQYETCRRILETELGAHPSGELERARVEIGRPASPPPSPPDAPVARVRERLPLVGRLAELAAIEERVTAAIDHHAPLLLVLGEPGIGKTRLLDELATKVRAASGVVLAGRAFEAEMVHPYGPWIDALRSAPLARLESGLRVELAPLLPELGKAPPAADRTRLFDAVARALAAFAMSAPTTVILDDLHWFDEASAALLHFATRALAGSRVLLACSARPGELADNPAVLRLVRGLARNPRVRELALGPLDESATAALARAVDPSVNPVRVFEESDGNPLFALELARAGQRGAIPATLDGLIGERLGRLGQGARTLVALCAALGRSFDLAKLQNVAGLAPAELLAGLDELERVGVLRASESGYDFVHDLLRRSAYRHISQPRRRLLHLQVARALAAVADPDGVLAGDIAHHAALGEDRALAARACATAGERCLRLFAHGEAVELAERGIAHSQGLPTPERVRLEMALHKVRVLATPPADRARELASVSRTLNEAQRLGMHAEQATGFYLLAVMHYKSDDLPEAYRDALRSGEAGRAADPDTVARHLGNSARCLAMLEREMARVDALLGEAQVMAEALGIEVIDIPWGQGIASAFAGDGAGAARLLSRALEGARAIGDHWAEWDCLARLVMLELEAGHAAAARERCAELAPVAARMGEGSEGPFAAALEAMADLAAGEVGAGQRLAAAAEALRAADARGRLAYTLLFIADDDLRAGRTPVARRHAEEALRATELVGRYSDVAVAHALLTRAAVADHDRSEVEANLVALRRDLQRPSDLSARARAAAEGALTIGVQTLAPTPSG
jgi:DNA-binding SARP family transcriptional activator